jgi:hypothetical protein
MMFYRRSNIAHNGSADWCSSQAPTCGLRRAIIVPFRALSVGISRTFFTAFDSAFAPKIAFVLPSISFLDDQKSVTRSDDEHWAIRGIPSDRP